MGLGPGRRLGERARGWGGGRGDLSRRTSVCCEDKGASGMGVTVERYRYRGEFDVLEGKCVATCVNLSDSVWTYGGCVYVYMCECEGECEENCGRELPCGSVGVSVSWEVCASGGCRGISVNRRG